MKLIFISMLVLLCPIFLCGQGKSSGIHGLVDEKGEQLFEIEGYIVSINETKGSLNDKTIRMIEQNYQLNQILTTYTDSTIKIENRVIEAVIESSDIPLKISQKCILLQRKAEDITVLYLETAIKRDFTVEQKILNACLKGELSEYASTDKVAPFIYLAGKKIHLPSGTTWTAPQKVTKENSQISWSEFTTESRANQYVSNQIIIDKAEDIEYVGEDDIEVLFDGEKTGARRIVYYDPLNEATDNYLIIYYLVCNLRGQSIACVLSLYGNSKEDLHLPELLESVMHIPAIDSPVSDINADEFDLYDETYNPLLFELQLSSWMPLGNLQKIYTVAPTLGMYMGYSFNKRMGIDMGFLFGIPANSKYFDYHEGSLVTVTEATYFIGLNLRWRYRKVISRNISSFTYLGIGGNWLSTDIESGYNEENDSYEYEKVGALDAFGGINIRYKKLGGFIEYHYTPYGNSDKVDKYFGHSSMNCGLSFIF